MTNTELVQASGSGRGVHKSRSALRPVGRLNLAVMAWVAMFCSILIFKASDLETAGLGNRDNFYRIALVLFAAVSSIFVLITKTGLMRQWLSGPVVLLEVYGLYAMITGLFLPAHALYAMWKGFEIAVDLLVVMALLSYRGSYANAYTAYKILVWSLTILIVVWWIEAAIWPSQAFVPAKGILRFQLQGLSPIYNPNTVGFASALVAFATLCEFFKRRGRLRSLVSLLVLLLAIATLIASQSRTGIAGFAIATSVYLLLSKRYWLMFIAILASSILFLVPTLGSVTEEYLVRGQTVGSLSTLSGRTYAWEQGWDAFWESPYLGNGFVAYTRSEIFGIGGSSHLHNAVLEVLVGTGILGFVLWFGAIVWTGILALKLCTTRMMRQLNDLQWTSGSEIFGLLLLVLARAATSSGPAFHDHSFMALLVVVAITTALVKSQIQHSTVHRRMRTTS